MPGDSSKPNRGMVVRGSDVSAVFCAFAILLVAILLARASWWGLVFQTIYLGMLIAVYWMGLSVSSYREELKRQESSFTRASYIQMNLLFFALGPTLVWFLVGLPLLIMNFKSRGWIHR